MSENKTSFSEMFSKLPLQKAQPTGGKFPANILISPIYASTCDLICMANANAIISIDNLIFIRFIFLLINRNKINFGQEISPEAQLYISL